MVLDTETSSRQEKDIVKPTDSRGSSETSIHESSQEPITDPASDPASLDEKKSPHLSEAGIKGSIHSKDEPRTIVMAEDPEDPEAGNATTTSTRSRTPSKTIPRSERRGLFGRFGIIPEVERPYDYPNRTKWTLTLIVALAGAGAPVGSSLIWPAMSDITNDLNTTDAITNFSVAFYMLSMSIFPLWWSAFSEDLGRRTVYILSFALFVVFSILSAVSNSISMFIVMRVLGGGASASVQAVGAGTIADIFEVHERGRAMGIFYLGPLLGPLLAPIIGGALTQAFGWQSTMWFLAIYGAVIWLLVFFFLPETLARKPKQQPQQQQQQQQGPDSGDNNTGQESGVNNNDNNLILSRTVSTRATSISHHTKRTVKTLKKYLIEPLYILAYLRFPPILLTVSYSALTFGALFVLNVSLQLAFSSAPYNYPALAVGLLYLPPSIGYTSAALVGGVWIDRIMRREAQRAKRVDAITGKLIYLPEDRMRENAWLSATLFPVALVMYGWTVQNALHWAVPSIATLLFGFGAMLVFGAATTMLTEFMPQRSSGGVAINNFARNIFSCVGAVVAEPMIRAMGHGWSLTLFALVAWLGGNACIWALRRFGARWRKDLWEKIG